MKVHVIINPAKSAKAPVLNILNRVFQEHGAQWDVSVTHGAGDAYRRAQEAAASGVDVVAVYGGDGTVTETASALVGAETPMAILPGGTGNVLAVEFGIPWQLHHAAALACRAAPHRVQAVDMGQVVRAGGDAPPAHEQAFMLRASTGFEAAVIEGTERTHKEQFGILAYGIAILQVLREPPAACYTLTLDGRQVECKGLSCLIANVRSLGRLNMTLGQAIRADDGMLDVIVIDRVLSYALLSLAAGTSETAPVMQHHWQAREIVIEADPPQAFQGDGDMWGKTPVEVRALPDAVRVMMPK